MRRFEAGNTIFHLEIPAVGVEIIQSYANDLMVAVQERGSRGPINLVEFFNWTTFDVLGDLAFGEPFGSLKDRKTSDYLS